MISLDSMDVQMDKQGQPMIEQTGETALIDGVDCWFQDVKNESITQEGELFYDTSYGWSMLDFTQMEHDELTELEIQNRIKEKLRKRIEVDERTIFVEIKFDGRTYDIFIQFKFMNVETEYNLELSMDGVEVKVVD